jgi:hypothetical protein
MTKYRIYIDEVGNPDLKSSEKEDHRCLCLTGVIFDWNGSDYFRISKDQGAML